MELGLVKHCFEDGDFIEGIRALIIDKDNKPRWRHENAEAVLESELSPFFESPWGAQSHPLSKIEATSAQ